MQHPSTGADTGRVRPSCQQALDHRQIPAVGRLPDHRRAVPADDGSALEQEFDDGEMTTVHRVVQWRYLQLLK